MGSVKRGERERERGGEGKMFHISSFHHPHTSLQNQRLGERERKREDLKIGFFLFFFIFIC